MNTADHLDGEIRRALAEIGDAAGIAPRFEHLADVPIGIRHPTRQLAWPVVGAAAAAAGLLALVIVTRPGSEDGSAGGSSTACVTSDACAPVAARSQSAQEAALQSLVQPLLPVGMIVVGTSDVPLQAIALDASGVRIDVNITLDGIDQIGRFYGPEDWHDVPEGRAAPGDSLIATPRGDVVSATAFYGPYADETPVTATARAAVPTLVAAVARALDGPARDALVGGDGGSDGMDGPVLAWVPGLAESVEGAIGVPVTVNGGRVVAAGDGTSARTGGTGPSDPGTALPALDIGVVRIGSQALPDGIMRPAADKVAASRRIGDWQVVVTSSGSGGSEALPDATLTAALDAAMPVLEAWTPAALEAEYEDQLSANTPQTTAPAGPSVSVVAG